MPGKRSTVGKMMGASFEKVDLPIDGDLVAVGRAADGALWIAGAAGSRLRSGDSGSTWQVIVEDDES